MKLFLFSLILCFSVAAQEKLLIFSKTAGYRHESIEDGIKAISTLAKKNQYLVDVSEDSQVMTDKNLKQYRAIIFLSTTGDILNAQQQLAFQRFIQAGGGFVGIHAASDTEYHWPWYMRLIGAQFSNHPHVQNAVQEKCECAHESIDFLPQKWTRKDEWYSFKNISPKIKVLLTLDESSYQGGKNGKNHPSAWYQEYDGGRMFYTAGGHTKESYKEELFLKHILGGINYACSGPQPDYTKVLPDDELFEINSLSLALNDPIAMAITPNDNVFIIERKGIIKLYKSSTQNIQKVHVLDAIYKEIAPKASEFIAKECGGLGIAIDPDFTNNKHIYVYYSPKEKSCNRLSRFTWKDGEFTNEKTILDVDTDRTNQTCHEGGSIVFGKNRMLYLSTGDNTNPFTSQGATPINELPGKKFYDSQRSAGNSNDLRGSILRIIINKDSSYSIPEDNLFPKGLAATRPEIYIKGCRNPYKISLDTKNGLLYWGEVGPDASNDTHRGPMGYDEFNQAKEAGYYGWPYYVGNHAYKDIDFSTATGKNSFADGIINNSPNNTGLQKLPPVHFPIFSYPYKKSDAFPELGDGSRNAMAGPVYHQEKRAQSFPSYFDETVFYYDWCRSNIMLIKLDKNKKLQSMTPFLSSKKFVHPIDMKQGPKGDIYVLTYGGGWWDNKDGSLQKISFDGFNRRPTLVLQTSNTEGAVPLKVEFSSQGSHDKDGDTMTYQWDFGDGRSSTEAHSKITYKTPGNYKASLTITDSAGRQTQKFIDIIAGNERPKVSLSIEPLHSSFVWGSEIKYKVSAHDKEDGVVSEDLIQVTAEYRPDRTIPSKEPQTSVQDPRLAGMNALLAGTKLIEKNNCLTCHQSKLKSIGPAYLDIAKKYEDNAANRKSLLAKLKTGGNGTWGHMPMPPQGHIAEAKLDQMLSAIFAMSGESRLIAKGANGTIKLITEPEDSKNSKGIYIIKATYTDKGANGISALTGESESIVLSPAIIVDKDKAVLSTASAIINGSNARKEGNNNIGFYRNTDTTINWNIHVAQTGSYEIYLYQAVAADKAGSTYEVQIGQKSFKGKIAATDGWQDYSAISLGTVSFDSIGPQDVIFKPLAILNEDLGNLKGIILRKN